MGGCLRTPVRVVPGQSCIGPATSCIVWCFQWTDMVIAVHDCSEIGRNIHHREEATAIALGRSEHTGPIRRAIRSAGNLCLWRRL